ncbi:hypothetical protein K438DRAFT_2099761, partial [Mycena galopus ATCC 62051]
IWGRLSYSSLLLRAASILATDLVYPPSKLLHFRPLATGYANGDREYEYNSLAGNLLLVSACPERSSVFISQLCRVSHETFWPFQGLVSLLNTSSPNPATYAVKLAAH